ncbi:MAG: hypothetical protein AB1490_12505 [Pseudomonadota bacterium]
MTFKSLLATAIAASLLMPAPAISAPDDGRPAKKRATMTVKKRIWKGYGFLPGYPRSERERQRDKYLSEPRYYTYYGGSYLGGGFYSGGYVSGPHYGWGRPGFYRGQWNGGSFGPCWTQTPIGPQWNCGM